MEIAVSEAETRLTDLVRRATDGDDVVLTLPGHGAVRLVPTVSKEERERRRALIQAVQASAVGNATPGPCAARSQDFLYDENGLPG